MIHQQLVAWRAPLGVPRMVVGVALALAAVAALASALDPEQLGAAGAAVLREPGILGLAVAAYVAAFWLRAVAGELLLPAASSPASNVRASALFSILHAGLVLNHALPVKAGELVRPALLARRGVPLAGAVTGTIAARALDVAALALLGSTVAAAAVGFGPLGATTLVAVLSVLLVALVGASVRIPLPRVARAWVARLQLGPMSARRLATCAALTLASWVLEGGMVLAAAHSLGVQLSVTTAIGATALAVASGVVHVTPGGIGVYELSMTGALVLAGANPEQALAIAVLTHGLKFVYAFTLGAAFALPAAISALRGRPEDGVRAASTFEVLAARLWNVLNEGKPFTPIFALGVIVLLAAPRLLEPGQLARSTVAFVAIVPLALVWWRFDFPLRLRAGLWVALVAFVAAFRFVSVPAAVLVLSVYLLFTVVLWGTVYYHLRIGTPWTNFTRFWRLVLENPDPTSGNFLEQVPKVLLLVFAFEYVAANASWASVLGLEAYVALVGISALLMHQWWFTWVPALPQRESRVRKAEAARTASRVIVIAIDGCRADRLREARTPFLDRLRAEGTDFTDLCTVYPARTVTAFASMLTGAPPAVHGMRSNFVPSLGVKCESIFDTLRDRGMRGVFVGIAHLIDAFGERDVRTVTAVMDNDDIDDALVARAQRVMLEEDPELLVLQLLSVDQTGHARGSYHEEYLRKIEETDARIQRFVEWCEERGYLESATVLVTSDHGQGIGIGGHGHMSEPEIRVPCIWWGASVEPGRVIDERRFLTEIAPTIAGLLGIPAPEETVGRALPLRAVPASEARPVVFVLPAHNEAANLPEVLGRIARAGVADTKVVVVDDGSTDATAAVAEAHGALVIRHERNRGLGAALRTGLAVARDLEPRAVIYLDADGEYDPADVPALLAPIERGEADYVLGSRFLGTVDGMTRSRRLANGAFSALLSLLCGRWISDGQTGMRAFSPRATDIAEIVHDYNYAQVLTLDLLHKGMRMTEVPISYRRRQQGRSFIKAEYLWRVPLGIAREMLGS